MFSKRNNITQSVYSIKDAPEQLITIVSAIIMLFISIFLILSWLASSVTGSGQPELMIYSILSVVISIMLLFRYNAIRDGYKLDLENHTMSFPGGGNAANDITDYFNLSYLLQPFMRKTIDLDAISEIRRKDTRHKIRGTVYENHLIEFVGTFGGTEIPISNKAKRDELFNAIRLSNGMGTPVFASTGLSNIPGAIPLVGGAVSGKYPPTSGQVGQSAPPARSLFRKKR